jgi:hypothetical protein
MKSESTYIAVTADMIGSRKDAAAVDRAGAKLNLFNSLFQDLLAVKFTLFRGDEIQGVFLPSKGIPRLIRQFRTHLRPLALRIGVGIGQIERGREREYSWQMDGSAFHRSRNALEQIAGSRIAATRFAGPAAAQLETINMLYTLVDAIESQWSEKQWQAVDAYDRNITFARAALELDSSPQSVNKHCRTARFKAISGAERFLDARLKELF